MIALLRGILAEKHPDHVILDVGGVGYRVFITLFTYEKLPNLGEEVRILTLTYVREDALHLYGFSSPEEKMLFVLLNNVTGIGTRLAISALSTLGTSTLATAIMTDDLNTLCLIPGVGRKTAQRLVIELKDRLPAGLPVAPVGGTGQGESGGSGAEAAALQPPSRTLLREELTSALMNLGYKRPEVERVLGQLLSGSRIATVGEGLRAALRALARPVTE